MKRLRLWLARLLLPRGWIAAPEAYLSYTTERFSMGCWPPGTVLHTAKITEPRA